MCGIVGAFALNGEIDPQLHVAIEPMTSAIAHRGPDGDGFYRDGTVVLGHRRLAIIDKAGGDQPISNEDGSCWIVFNGEIYNHRTLRRELVAKGHVFRTRSDTEAIVHAYEEFGVECLSRLEGMFAFAIYDRRTRELFVARDRIGKKPLFWANFKGVLHFASEIKALRVSPLWDGTIDASQIEGYLTLGYVTAPATIYRHVEKLLPGHWLRCVAGRTETRKYWDIDSFDDYAGSEQQAVQELEAQLADRVSERLESEVPLGAFLSGGIDSGLVVSFMAGAQSQPVTTTTVGFDQKAHNELDLASLTARQYGTTHHTHILEASFDEVSDKLVQPFDEPFADSSSIPTFYVSREARRHVTVALSGDGGDETFGGYDFRYIPHAVEHKVRSHLQRLHLQRAASWLGPRWPRSRRLPRPLRLGTYLTNVGGPAESAYFSDMCLARPDETSRLLGRSTTRRVEELDIFERIVAPYRRCPSPHPVQRAEYADVMGYLPNDVLVKVDRMSMQNSLEVRCPLLDRRLVELAFRLPQTFKRADRRGKHLLKEVAKGRLTEAVIAGRKHGFSAPIDTWLGQSLGLAIREDVLSSQSTVRAMLDAKHIAALFDEHQRGHRDRSYLLWAVWILERWARLDRSTGRPATAAVLAT
jgi:asparagine synthase (glutamine-hydrolysing)